MLSTIYHFWMWISVTLFRCPKKNRHSFSNQAFSLIELLVAIVLIGITMSTFYFVLDNMRILFQRQKARSIALSNLDLLHYRLYSLTGKASLLQCSQNQLTLKYIPDLSRPYDQKDDIHTAKPRILMLERIYDKRIKYYLTDYPESASNSILADKALANTNAMHIPTTKQFLFSELNNNEYIDTKTKMVSKNNVVGFPGSSKLKQYIRLNWHCHNDGETKKGSTEVRLDSYLLHSENNSTFIASKYFTLQWFQDAKDKEIFGL